MLQFWGGIPQKQSETLNSYESVQNCSFGRRGEREAGVTAGTNQGDGSKRHCQLRPLVSDIAYHLVHRPDF
jgi:hypothetical protein